jgi:hypothetical protein
MYDVDPKSGQRDDEPNEYGTWSLNGNRLTITDSEGETMTGTASGNSITMTISTAGYTLLLVKK